VGQITALARPNVTSLAISIVTHAPDLTLLARVLEHLGRALRHASQRGDSTEARLVLVDNGPGRGWREPLRRVLDAAALPATVEDITFLGASIHLAARTAWGEAVAVRLPYGHPAAAGLARGQSIGLGFEPAAAHCFL